MTLRSTVPCTRCQTVPAQRHRCPTDTAQPRAVSRRKLCSMLLNGGRAQWCSVAGRLHGPRLLADCHARSCVGVLAAGCNVALWWRDAQGMPHKYYHGKTGVVWNVTKRSVGVEVNKQVWLPAGLPGLPAFYASHILAVSEPGLTRCLASNVHALPPRPAQLRWCAIWAASASAAPAPTASAMSLPLTKLQAASYCQIWMALVVCLRSANKIGPFGSF